MKKSCGFVTHAVLLLRPKSTFWSAKLAPLFEKGRISLMMTILDLHTECDVHKTEKVKSLMATWSGCAGFLPAG